MGSIIDLTGNNYEIGEQLGHFWGDYFESLRNKGFPIINRYLEWLNHNIPDHFIQLYRNTERMFPDLMMEIEGMANGINNSKLITNNKVTPQQIFTRSLWEDKRNCTSAIFKTDEGYFICHCLEDDAPPGLFEGVYPLCISKVNLSNGFNHKFVSFSYPFSLLGTIGFNRFLAFQGNTIGNIGKSKRYHHRIPYSVFQRKLLEMTTEAEIKLFLDTHHIAIPGHNYIVFHDKAYSLEIRPQNIRDPTFSQYKLIPRDRPWHTHTNYFRHSTVDKNWLFETDQCTCDWRFEKITDFCSRHPHHVDSSKMTKFLAALAHVNFRYTSGFAIIKISSNSTFCSGETFFGNGQVFQLNLD